MLRSLHIENYAIIQNVDLHFDNSLNIITGETGAGKSIIMGALSLVMGQRADSSALYDKDNKCIIEASFTDYPKAIDLILDEHDFDIDEELIIRREISATGKSRAFVNDTPSKLDVLQLLAEQLIDLNSQFELTSIHQSRFQLQMIDVLADNKDLLEEYKALYAKYKKYQREYEALKNIEGQQLKELEFVRFQLNELADADLHTSEQDDLENEKTVLDKAEALRLLCQESGYMIADSENGIADRMRSLAYKWEDFASVNDILAKLNDLFSKLDDDLAALVDHIEKLESSLEADPGRLTEIDERLDLIYELQRKHQVNTVDELLGIQTAFEAQLSGFENKTERIAWLEKEIESILLKLNKQAAKLSKSRKAVFAKLEKEVNGKLSLLAMASSEVKVEHNNRAELADTGLDDIQILFKANKGSDFLPIRKIASGGESARLMLSLKSTVAHAMRLPTMIFDEIDSGVSGEVAGKMGELLRRMADDHQLICITHSPQVAARAVKHFFVFKEDMKQRTVTHVKTLEDETRINEIAKMLSGDPPTAFALENAKELISS